MVIDITAPIATLNRGIDTVELGETWIDAEITAVDNYFDDYTVEVSGTVISLNKANLRNYN